MLSAMASRLGLRCPALWEGCFSVPGSQAKRVCIKTISARAGTWSQRVLATPPGPVRSGASCRARSSGPQGTCSTGLSEPKRRPQAATRWQCIPQDPEGARLQEGCSHLGRGSAGARCAEWVPQVGWLRALRVPVLFTAPGVAGEAAGDLSLPPNLKWVKLVL